MGKFQWRVLLFSLLLCFSSGYAFGNCDPYYDANCQNVPYDDGEGDWEWESDWEPYDDGGWEGPICYPTDVDGDFYCSYEEDF